MPGKKSRRSPSKEIVATAFHEAGHAIANITLGLGFKYVTIEPDKAAGSLGHMTPNDYPAWFNPEIDKSDRGRLFAEKQILSCFAGDAAEAHWRGRHNWRGMRCDFHQLANLTSYVCGFGGEEEAAYIKWLHIRARNLIVAREHWLQVKIVANTLLKQKHITKRVCERIINEDFCKRTNKEFVGCSNCSSRLCKHAGASVKSKQMGRLTGQS
jgi:hypothetical protein